MSKVVSQLDSDGYFYGQTVADESPLEVGVFLMPVSCVDLPAPHNVVAGIRYKLVGDEWVGDEWVGESIPVPVHEQVQGPVLTPEEIAAAEVAEKRATTLSAISLLEVQQARPVREIVAALAQGAALPAIAVENIGALDSQIADLRKLL